MIRRFSLAIFLLILCAGAAQAKWKEEEQQYLDEQFKALQDQLRSLKTQVDALTTHVNELRQNQAQVQVLMVRQLKALDEAQQLAAAMRMGGEENYSSLKSAINQLRADTQKSFSALLGQPVAAVPAEVVAPARTAPAVAMSQGVQGYVMVIEGDTVTVDLGSSRGIHEGSRLVVYKATDPNTQVGLLEVKQVVDKDNARARILQMNPGVRLDWGDMVRPQQ